MANFVSLISIYNLTKKTEIMKPETYVVWIQDTSLYLNMYNPSRPEESLFGNLSTAIEFGTLSEAENKAALIGGGTVGTPKPK